ncbi:MULTISPECIES: glucosaminidase domain-containing protein [unclassified Dysgonomonas]|uniref:glucosaminidase domain-containing protein n=1 Tax=unclassified Dysgonomonas TaxID=2630389 RepID=UPI0013E9A2CA|nr:MULTISPECIES: glucosaminidase domain-containing protein [unclassified Dysgonomonas]
MKYPSIALSKLIVLSVLILLPTISAFSQAKRYKTYDDYIDTYKGIAIDHMKKYKIPASITLAQGLLESGAGKSSLTQSSNNHFGIKCHNDWKGEKVYKADDTPNDCFRKYKKAEESYDDHSRFLAEKPRYKNLFALEITDYRGWAKGLQQAGYATDKAYANKLIKLIEDYELYQHDRQGKSASKIKKEEERFIQQNYKHTPYKTHNLVYVLAQDGDTYEAIAVEFGFKPKDLYKHNEVPEGFPLKAGDLVYFEKKKSKADKPYYEHTVQVGESMHSISQLYGIKVKNLYKMNKKDFEYVPEEGDVLKLR